MQHVIEHTCSPTAEPEVGAAVTSKASASSTATTERVTAKGARRFLIGVQDV